MTSTPKKKPLPELAAEIDDLRLQAEKFRSRGNSLAAYAAELDSAGLLAEYHRRQQAENKPATV